MKNAFAKLEGDLAGEYYPLLGMEESVRQQLVDDHFLFMSGDRNLQVTPDLLKFLLHVSNVCEQMLIRLWQRFAVS